jgi:hypothetical protein
MIIKIKGLIFYLLKIDDKGIAAEIEWFGEQD